MTYFTSDLHFGHNKEFIYKARGFSSIEEMNNFYVQNWNGTVTEEDDIYVLGDFMMGGVENLKYIAQLNGQIHLIIGNHDTPNKIALFKESLSNIVEIVPAAFFKHKKYTFYLSHWPCMTGNLDKESLKKMTLNLYGHTHQTTNFYEDRPYMYHVGVDSHPQHILISIEQIVQEMKEAVEDCKSYLDISQCSSCMYELICEQKNKNKNNDCIAYQKVKGEA